MSWEDVTLLRKAMSKSYGKEYFDTFRDKFLAGALSNQIPREAAAEIWDMVNTMGSWAFNLSHSYSYAVLSYWTAWLKAHHPLEFAAATLRNETSDESVVGVLRELARESRIEYIPFDPERSDVSWSVQDGKLFGGFTGLKGIGESKAKKLIELRTKHGGRLPEPERDKVLALPRSFDDLFPTERRFGTYYSDPARHGIRPGTRVTRIAEISGEGQFVYVGRMVGKDLRDQNEAIRVHRRGGKRISGPSMFLDLDIQDDTGKILTRVDRYDFESMGRSIWENAPLGSWWLVRGERRLFGGQDTGFKMIFVTKIKELQP